MNQITDNSIQDDDKFKYLLFCLNEKKYAVETSQVLEIVNLPGIDCPEKLPKYICGLLNYNNLIVNIVDINAILNFPHKTFSLTNQLIMLKTEDLIFGIVTDKVLDLLSIESDNIHPKPYNSAGNIIKFISYCDNSMISVIDLDAVEKLMKENDSNYEESAPLTYLPQDENSLKILEIRKAHLINKSAMAPLENFYNLNQYLLFTIAGHFYCLNIDYVKELVKLVNMKITQVPCTPNYIRGIINLKGDFISVLDMNEFLYLSNDCDMALDRVIVLNVGEFKLALLVNEILDILDIPDREIKSPADDKCESKYLLGEFIKNDVLYRILDIKAILSDNKLFIGESV